MLCGYDAAASTHGAISACGEACGWWAVYAHLWPLIAAPWCHRGNQRLAQPADDARGFATEAPQRCSSWTVGGDCARPLTSGATAAMPCGGTTSIGAATSTVTKHGPLRSQRPRGGTGQPKPRRDGAAGWHHAGGPVQPTVSPPAPSTQCPSMPRSLWWRGDGGIVPPQRRTRPAALRIGPVVCSEMNAGPRLQAQSVRAAAPFLRGWSLRRIAL